MQITKNKTIYLNNDIINQILVSGSKTGQYRYIFYYTKFLFFMLKCYFIQGISNVGNVSLDV